MGWHASACVTRVSMANSRENFMFYNVQRRQKVKSSKISSFYRRYVVEVQVSMQTQYHLQVPSVLTLWKIQRCQSDDFSESPDRNGCDEITKNVPVGCKDH